MTRFTHDVAVSAVSYDARLVTEIARALAPNVGGAVYWRGDEAEHDDGVPTSAESSEALGQSARLALVLHQRLWGRDPATEADVLVLRERARARRQTPICVVAVDEAPSPSWLAHAPRCTLQSLGIEGVATFVLDMLDASNASGRPRRRVAATTSDALRRPGWGNTPIPYLAQSRALSSLRREFDALAAELARHIRAEGGRALDPRAELHCAPQRLVVQLGAVGLSFSWVAGRSGTIADGRLLVIEWEGVVAHARGLGAMRTASPTREHLFRPDANGPDDWCWRAADYDGGSYSSRDLAGQSFAGALMTLGT